MHSAHSITEICLIALGIIFTALLLMAVASTMLAVPVVTPKLQRLQGMISQTA